MERSGDGPLPFAAVLLSVASLTEPLVNLAINIINDLGVAGVALLTFSSAVIGLPGTEPTMLFAGFNAYQGHLTMIGITFAGLIGDIGGASVAYAIGYYGRRDLLERHGSKLHISTKRLDVAHRWFERHGAPAVFVSRLIPVVRAAFPYVAGVAEMGYLKFVTVATLGSIIWIVGLAELGHAVGSNWQNWRHHLEIVDYIGAAIVVAAIVYLVIRRRRGPGGGEPTPAADASA